MVSIRFTVRTTPPPPLAAAGAAGAAGCCCLCCCWCWCPIELLSFHPLPESMLTQYSILGAHYTAGATIFPQSINMASTFSSKLGRQFGFVTAKDTKASQVSKSLRCCCLLPAACCLLPAACCLLPAAAAPAAV